MPLHDHFHPPISAIRHWESFHAAWATEIMRTLNRDVLPEGCFAEAQVHVGSQVEIDVATFEHAPANGSAGDVAVACWSPPKISGIMPMVFPDVLEVQVFQDLGGPRLVGAVELVSPGNKDRPETRQAFVAKCASYLQQGIGLVIVDIVTNHLTNLHNELIRLLQQGDQFMLPASANLYTTAFRPRRLDSGDGAEIWLAPLALGKALPTMPLALQGIGVFPLELEATYRRTCQDSRLPAEPLT